VRTAAVVRLTDLTARRYIEQLPAAGEIVLFDRSWYNRAGVECGSWVSPTEVPDHAATIS
jgi:polyphosphate kinase 2 (PPK2 family)